MSLQFDMLASASAVKTGSIVLDLDIFGTYPIRNHLLNIFNTNTIWKGRPVRTGS